jgi:uncharacterized membrane protein
MADAAERAVTAYFDSAAQAAQAAQDLMRWDKADDDVKLGALGVLTKDAEGKLATKNLSARNTGKGAKIGLGLGALAAVFSGGLTLIPTAVAGAAGGAVIGSLSKKGLGMSDEDLQQLSAQLEGGHAALLVLCDDPDVEATAAQLAASGGTVRRRRRVPRDPPGGVPGRGRGPRGPGRTRVALPRRAGGAGIGRLTPPPRALAPGGGGRGRGADGAERTQAPRRDGR